MKILFFIALLMNIVFFLWEFNSVGLNSPLGIAEVDSDKSKQILLVSELPHQDEGKNLVIAENNRGLYDPYVSLELKSATNAKMEEVAEESSKQLLSIEESFEKSMSSDELPENDQIVQNTLHNGADISASGSQVDNISVSPPVLEEKSLAVESQEEVIVNSLLNSDESDVEQVAHDNIYCYQVGPFAGHDALNAWHKVNEANADLVSRFTKESKVVSRYLVYYPPAETYAQSRDNVQLLKQKGVTDYWLFRKGKLKGAISLGLFVKKKGALSIQAKFVKAGLAVEIKERYQLKSLLYAEIFSEDKAFKDTVIISDKQSVSECENNTGLELVTE